MNRWMDGNLISRMIITDHCQPLGQTVHLNANQNNEARQLLTGHFRPEAELVGAVGRASLRWMRARAMPERLRATL